MTETTARPAPAPAPRHRSRAASSAMLAHGQLDPAARVARGRAARAAVPRESHAALDLPPARPDPVALLESQAAGRLPDLVPIRYGRMLISPFSFYRGAALIMAHDLASTPSSGLIVQACGDAHLLNFGLFASPERQLVFDVNDFDETLPAPWEWDVKRLAASVEVAARGNGISARHRRKLVLASVAGYRTAMRDFAGQGNLDVWFTQQDIARLREKYQSDLAPRGRKRLDKSLAKAPDRDNLRELAKLTTTVDGQPRIVADPPLIVPLADLPAGQVVSDEAPAAMRALMAKYLRTLQADRQVLLRQFQYADMARKVVGVGSVGMRCWVILLTGRDLSDPLFLQVKEAKESVLSQFAGRSDYANQGQRVVAGQRIMQAASDIFLGWQRITDPDGTQHDYYVRALRDWKLSVDVTTMTPRGLRTYGALCGHTLARAHARSGDRIAIGAYLGAKDPFDQAVADFAAAYADQNDRDYHALGEAADAGQVTVRRGV